MTITHGLRSTSVCLWSLIVSLFLGSSALRSILLSENILTTMASADFSDAQTSETSPGKVRSLSARAVRLYRTWLSVTVGFRATQHAHRPGPASLPIRVPTVVPLLTASFRFVSRLLPCGSLRLSSLTPVITSQITRLRPCRAHEVAPFAGAWIETLYAVLTNDVMSRIGL